MGQGPSGLAARETVQLLLTFVCLVGYTLAIGSLAGRRGRVVAGTAALLAAIGLVAGAPSWEAGLMLVAWLPIGIGLFAAAAWCLWNATEWHVAKSAAMSRTTGQPQLALRLTSAAPSWLARPGTAARRLRSLSGALVAWTKSPRP
jgi:hypothetical protein